MVRLRALQPHVPGSLRDARQSGDPPEGRPDGFATHSTHKLLAALSQTSYIHIRDGRGAIDHGRFNEAYCSQASTSPLYALIASNDVAAAMMDGPGGRRSPRNASTRRSLAASRSRARSRNFSPRRTGSSRRGIRECNPKTGRSIPFHKAPEELLRPTRTAGSCIPATSWHGFEGLPDGWCMLDPIKFGIVCPGMKTDGQLDKTGIPATSSPRISVATASCRRAPPTTWSCSCSRWASPRASGARCSTRCSISRPTTIRNAARRRSPALVEAAPQRYAGKGLKDLGDEMWAHLRKSRQGHWQAQAYATLPKPKMTPRRAFQRLMAGDAEKVPLDKMANRVVAVGVIPYPPGIPIVMPERALAPPTAVDHLPAHAAGVRPSVSRIRQGSGGRRRT